MSSNVTIMCDGQWPAKPMYANECWERISSNSPHWPNAEFAREQAKAKGWVVMGERDVCPACQVMIFEQKK